MDIAKNMKGFKNRDSPSYAYLGLCKTYNFKKVMNSHTYNHHTTFTCGM